MARFPAPPAPMPPTPIPEVQAKLDRVAASREKWVKLASGERAALLRRCMERTLAVADRWASTACAIKGYPEGSAGHGEEYLAGTLPTMRNLRLYAEALEANGQPRLPKTWQRPDGQWVARTFPQSLKDQALFTGVSCEVWIQPGKEPTQGQLYRDKARGKLGDGGVSVVLGAGNVASIPAMDVLYKLVVDDEVCLLKMNPVNEQLGPVLAEALSPLVEGGFLEIVYGGIEQGKFLTDHPEVTSIHITGSAAAHDAIIWGPGEQGAANKEAGTPRLDKHITSELGCVSPVLVVPGEWSDKELRYQAQQVVSMLANNCGFNCTAARLVVVASGWTQKERFLSLVKERLAATPTRKAYYPTGQATWERFTEAHPNYTALGDDSDGALPWTVLDQVSPENDFITGNEPWAGIFSFVELEATGAADFLDVAVPFANDQCWGTLTANVLVHPRTERSLGPRFDAAIAALRYGGIGINCWTGLSYGLVNPTWGAFPGHPLDDIQSGQGVVHNGLLLDHPQKSVVRAPFVMFPKPAWFADHNASYELGRAITRYEAGPSWLGIPRVALPAVKG